MERYEPLIMIFGGLFGFVAVYYFTFWAFSL
jgi:hypothetical protein